MLSSKNKFFKLSRPAQFGWLYGSIVFTFLTVCNLTQLSRPEWGLATTVVLFGSEREQTIKKCFQRLAATLAAGGVLLLMHELDSVQTYVFLICICILVGAHLSLRYPNDAYFYFVFALTLAVLGFSVADSWGSGNVQASFRIRVIQIGLASLITLPPLLCFLRFNPSEVATPSSSRRDLPTHADIFLRAALIGILFGVVFFYFRIPGILLGGIMVATFFAASATMCSPLPILRLGLAAFLAAMLFSTVAKFVLSYLGSVPEFAALAIATFCGWLMSKSMADPEHGMAWKLVLIFSVVLYSAGANLITDASACFQMLFVFTACITMIAFSHLLVSSAIGRWVRSSDLA